MIRCRICSFEVAEDNRFCGGCGAPVGTLLTQTIPPLVPSTPSEGRFPAGTVLGGRYRILGLAGKGGMGEVYRAHDLKLDQPVALKLLPEALRSDAGALARFHNEVRTARQVSHPNVCRVYDIGEADGLDFLSMEFIDGEDLASLLRRIGRLPQDKGIEMARKLCAALSAAHERGVLHRDLKPANIMLNAAGQVLITDFGLAGVAAQFRAADLRSGTPAYMAWEQLEGREVTPRSDIYALGLVLYEMFTGRHPFKGRGRGDITKPSSLVKELDPALERVILRCLEPVPQDRPHTALAVAMALPGGDPLAAALAAGETPSPEMVAASGEEMGISVRGAMLCFAGVVVLLILTLVLAQRWTVAGRAPPELPPEALEARAREIAAAAGYPERPQDTARGFHDEPSYLEYLEKKKTDWSRLGSLRPTPISFWYRESPEWLVPRGREPGVTPEDPPPLKAGMIKIRLDARGRLLEFHAVPPRSQAAASPSPIPDWPALFSAAQLDPRRFQEASPEWAPRAGSDVRKAWTGSYAEAPEMSVRVEAAGFAGRPVFFLLVHPWTTAARSPAGQFGIAYFTVYAICAMGACLLAWRNARSGRGDRRGALRLAAVALLLSLLGWAFKESHAPVREEVDRMGLALGQALYYGGFVFALYMALEPYARRHWPWTIISYSRLIAGRLRDPLVGRDVLIGLLVGLTHDLLLAGHGFHASLLGYHPSTSTWTDVFLGPRHLLAQITHEVIFALSVGLTGLVVILVLRAVSRKQWLAVVLGCLVLTLVYVPTRPTGPPGLVAPYLLAVSALWFWALLRFGVVAGSLAAVALNARFLPLTTNLSAWYAPLGWLGLAGLLGVAVYGFWAALGGRRLLGEDLLGG